MQAPSNFWWQYDLESNFHEKLFEKVRQLNNKQSYRSADNLRHMRLYGNNEILGTRLGEYTVQNNLSRLTLNIIQSVIDTKTAKIAKNKPKATFLTEDGDWKKQQESKKLEKYVAGCMYKDKLYTKGPILFRDSDVFGSGVLKFYENGKDICSERVFPEEIKVEDSEAIYGAPRTIYQTKYVSKAVLKARFQDEEIQAKIDAAPAPKHQYMVDKYSTEMIEVVEAWRLPSGKTSGRHVICIEGADLLKEDWKRDYFPFVFLNLNPKLLGFWGQGAAERLTGLQVEINKILKRIQLCVHLGLVPTLYLQYGSRIVKSHLNNKVGNIIEYEGTAPQDRTLMEVPVQLFQQLESLVQKAYEQEGISQLSAQAKNPLGANASGKAFRIYNDIESERFQIEGQRYEEFFMECARMYINMSKDMRGDHTVRAIDKNRSEEIKWSQINLKDDAYVMKIYPTNLFSSTPAAKLSEVQEMMTAGFFTPEEAMMLLDFPDLEGVTSMKTAALKDIKRTIDTMVEKGDYLPPEKYQNLRMGVKMCQEAYLKYKNAGLNEDRLELLAQWIDDADAMIAEADAAAQEQAMAMQAMAQNPTQVGQLNLEQAAQAV